MTRDEAIRYLLNLASACKYVDTAIEALQAEPVKHGEWRYFVNGSDKWALCSECGIVSVVGGKYCPNCGAKMEGGADK